MSPRSRTLSTLCIGLVLGFLLARATFAIAQRHAPSPPMPLPAIARDLRLPVAGTSLFAEVLARVRAHYVDAIDEPGLQRAAARAVLAGLDAHSTLLSQAEYAELEASTRGSYAGVGVEIEGAGPGVRVLRTLAGSPARQAGLLPGDLIERIDGLVVNGRNLDDALLALRGAPGSLLQLQWRRADGPARQLELRRSQVALASVVGRPLPGGYGYLRISEFTSATAGEVARALAALQGAGAGGGLRGLVLDLRDNPGGVLGAAAAVADDFLEAGTIVTAEGHASEGHFRLEATPGDLLAGAPIAVLVNGRSASAAEILAAALRDNHRATLVGERTYGKGTVQTILPLPTGEALRLTTSRYYTPAGRSPDGSGLQPDIALAGTAAPAGAPAGDAGVALALEALRNPRLARTGARPGSPRRS